MTKAKRELSAFVRENDSLKEQLEATNLQLEKAIMETQSKSRELAPLQEKLREVQQRLSEAQGDVIPGLQSDLQRAEERLRSLSHKYEQMQSEYAGMRDEREHLIKKAESLNERIQQMTKEYNDQRGVLGGMTAQRDELIKHVREAEKQLKDQRKRLDELEAQHGQCDRIRVTVENSLNERLRALSKENSELRIQASSQATGRDERSQRLERLQQTLSEVERRNEELTNKLMLRDGNNLKDRKALDELQLEKKALEDDLRAKTDQIERLEQDIQRLRRERYTTIGTAPSEELQARLDHLQRQSQQYKQSLMEADSRIAELKTRLLHSEEDRERFMRDIETLREKLHRREGFIKNAIARIEQLNSSTQFGGSGSDAAALLRTSSDLKTAFARVDENPETPIARPAPTRLAKNPPNYY